MISFYCIVNLLNQTDWEKNTSCIIVYIVCMLSWYVMQGWHLPDSVACIGMTRVVPVRKLVVNWREVCVNCRDCVPCWDKNFEMFKILVTTKFRDRVVNYAQTVREHVGTMREDACQCLTVRAMPRLSRIVHEQLTSSSQVVYDMFTSSSQTV